MSPPSPSPLPHALPRAATPPPITPPHVTATLKDTRMNPKEVDPAAWSGLKSLLKVVESSPAFGPLKSALSRFKECIDILERNSENNEEYKRFQRQLDSLLEDLAQNFGGTTMTRMTGCMMNLIFAIDRQLALVEEISTTRAGKRHSNADEDANRIMGCYLRVQGYLERLVLNANLNIWMRFNVLEAEALLRSICPSFSGLYNSAFAGEVFRRSCTPGTRVSATDKLIAWSMNPVAESVYWVNGMAGTGKTTIAYNLCDELDQRAALGASFFCSRLVPECRNINLIIPAIAYQLALFSVPFRSALLQVLEADPGVHTRGLKIQFENLLQRPLLEVQDTLPPDFVVVVDALDECDNKRSVGELLDILLSQRVGLIPPIRFLLSSRPEPEIYSRLMGHLGDSLDAQLVLHEQDQETVRCDIQTYIREELGDLSFTPDQLASLARRSGALFCYASTAARYIKSSFRSMDHEERLNSVLGLTPGEGGEKFHMIDSLYGFILRAALHSPSCDESDIVRLKEILDTVICARELMTVSELAELLDMRNSAQFAALLELLNPVLVVSGGEAHVVVPDTSFLDFMLDPTRSSPFHCDQNATDCRTARACFKVMENLRFNICDLESSFVFDNAVLDLPERVDRCISPALSYASRFWGEHLQSAAFTDELYNHLCTFLSLRLLFWMEVLSLKKCITTGATVLSHLEGWLIKNDCHPQTIKQVAESRNFVAQFAESPCSLSTPHIYISALPFLPKANSVYANYWRRTKGLLDIEGSLVNRLDEDMLATWVTASEVYSVTFSADGALISTGSCDGRINVMDAHTGQMVVEPFDCGAPIYSVAFSPSGAHIISGCDSSVIQLWDLDTKNTSHRIFEGHTGSVHSLAFSPDGTRLVSGSRDCTIRVWDIDTGMLLTKPLQGHTRAVNSVGFCPNGERIVSGSADCTVRIWDSGSGNVVAGPFTGHTKAVLSTSFAPDGTRIASGSEDCTIRICSLPTGALSVEPLIGHTSSVRCIAFSPNGTQMVSGSTDCTIKVWDVSTGTIIAGSFRGHVGPICSVAFSPNGVEVLSGSTDCTVRVWDARTPATAPALLEFEWYTAYTSDTKTGPLYSEYILSNLHQMCVPSLELQVGPYSTSVGVGGTAGLNEWVTVHDAPLFWVPPSLRNFLPFLPNTFIISHRGSARINYENLALGERWSECFHSEL